jgi:hypothetical protein
MKLNFKTLDYLYFHTSGAGNTGYASIITTKRTYVIALAAATANSVQFAQPETVQRIIISSKCAAAGAIEVSLFSTTNLATTPAPNGVIARLDIEPVTTSGLPVVTQVIELN